MGETIRPWDVDQGRLSPPAAKDLLPARHPARLVREVVREELDLPAICARYEALRGYPPYHPAIMTALLLQLLAPPRAGVRGAGGLRGFRQFLHRGIRKVAADRALPCSTHNLPELLAVRGTMPART